MYEVGELVNFVAKVSPLLDAEIIGKVIGTREKDIPIFVKDVKPEEKFQYNVYWFNNRETDWYSAKWLEKVKKA
tara:strand:- start:111 stop:332 length:222 start_codon:yes stop_codon:yes gene_type:complete